MIKMILSGILGTMGKTLLAAVKASGDLAVVAGIDPAAAQIDGIPVFRSFSECACPADVVVDFSNPAALCDLIRYCEKTKTPAVICTTGFSEQQEQAVTALSSSVPVFRSANMSLGVNLLASLAKTSSRVFGDAFDIEIIEKHHRKKVDAPSGTAMMLAKEINRANGDAYRFVYERESVRQPRGGDEIGIHTIRGGTIVGEHEIIFAGPDEVMALSHSASSKGVFATGAISAAKFLMGQNPGYYGMNDLFEG